MTSCHHTNILYRRMVHQTSMPSYYHIKPPCHQAITTAHHHTTKSLHFSPPYHNTITLNRQQTSIPSNQHTRIPTIPSLHESTIRPYHDTNCNQTAIVYSHHTKSPNYCHLIKPQHYTNDHTPPTTTLAQLNQNATPKADLLGRL